MQESMDDVRYDIETTRARMSETLAALDSRVHERVDAAREAASEKIDAVKERLDLFQLVRDHPWSAMAAALVLGTVVGASGADRKAASATKDAISDGSRAGLDRARDLAHNTVSAVKERLHGGSGEAPSHGRSEASGERERTVPLIVDYPASIASEKLPTSF